MRIRFTGKPSPDEFARRVAALADDLGALGVDALGSPNIYFRPKRGGRDLEIWGPDGEPVELIDVIPDEADSEGSPPL